MIRQSLYAGDKAFYGRLWTLVPFPGSGPSCIDRTFTSQGSRTGSRGSARATAGARECICTNPIEAGREAQRRSKQQDSGAGSEPKERPNLLDPAELSNRGKCRARPAAYGRRENSN
jgi:hypothetical protein